MDIICPSVHWEMTDYNLQISMYYIKFETPTLEKSNNHAWFVVEMDLSGTITAFYHGIGLI